MDFILLGAFLLLIVFAIAAVRRAAARKHQRRQDLEQELYGPRTEDSIRSDFRRDAEIYAGKAIRVTRLGPGIPIPRGDRVTGVDD